MNHAHSKLNFINTTPTYLSVAVRHVLFGVMLLPLTSPLANAELIMDTQYTALSESDEMSKTTAIDTTKTDTIDTAASLETQTLLTDDSMSNMTTSDDLSTDTPSVINAKNTPDDDPAKQTRQALTKPAVATDKQTAKQQSLAKLAQNYQVKPNVHARCQGVWTQPKNANQIGNNAQSFAGIKAEADYGYWDAHEYAELAGNVIIEQNGQTVMADKATFNTRTGEAMVQGEVQFSDGMNAGENGIGLIGVAQSISYGNQNGLATAQDVAFASTAINAHGYAGSMQKVSDTHYQMDEVMFTTCPPTERKWHLDAQRIDIDSQTGRAIAKNSTLRIKDVPVLYLPYFNFPIDSRRSSGFLLPSVGFGSSDGLEVSTPYYFNLAPNYDATITPTIFTNRNPMISGEFRYLTKNFGAGSLSGSYLPSDRKYNNQDRSRLRYEHQWQAKNIKNLTGYAQYQYVSDADYLGDFDSLGLENRSLNLPRRIGLNYHNDHVAADFRFETFQRLDGTKSDGSLITDKDRPYARLPQLSINYRLPKSWLGLNSKLQITGVHNSAYFKKSIKDASEPEKSGGRMYNRLSASYPMLRPWGYITPKLSLTHLYASYDEDSLNDQNLNKKDGSYSIFAPQFSVDAGLFFEKAGSPLKGKQSGGYQVLSPRLKYTYTPYKDQSRLPNFETIVSNISYDQLLSDSWFLGYDRIQDLHAITPAINYRYIDEQGRTRFDGSIAEQILLDELRVGINHSESFSGRSSGTAWQASIQPKESLWIDTAGALTTNYDISAITAQIRYQPDEQRLFNIGVIERKENKATNQQALSAYTASAILPISSRWRLVGQAQYDYKHERLLDSLIGVNYEDCCYGLSVYARRYRDGLNPHTNADTAIMAELRLNGISNGGRLNRLLSDKVMGYDSVQNAWQKAY